MLEGALLYRHGCLKIYAVVCGIYFAALTRIAAVHQLTDVLCHTVPYSLQALELSQWIQTAVEIVS